MEDKRPHVAIVDYRMGNLFSVKNACTKAGLEAIITSSPEEILKADALILPGVGSFGEAMKNLGKLKLIDTLMKFVSLSKPLIGICLGMQLLMEESFEFGHHRGLGIITGRVVSLKQPHIKVPHICWNRLYRTQNANWSDTLLNGLPEGVFMYFVHSFYVEPEEETIKKAVTRYGNVEFCSAIHVGNIFACQCHPERSGKDGLRVYKNLARKLLQGEVHG